MVCTHKERKKTIEATKLTKNFSKPNFVFVFSWKNPRFSVSALLLAGVEAGTLRGLFGVIALEGL